MENVSKRKFKKIRLIVGIICLVSFFFMFGTQISWLVSSFDGHNVILNFSFKDVSFGIVTVRGITKHFDFYGTPICLFGYIFLALGGICAIISAFIQNSPNKIEKYVFDILINLLILSGSIMILFERAAFVGVNVGNIDNEAKLAACPIIAGVIGCISSLGMVAAVVTDK